MNKPIFHNFYSIVIFPTLFCFCSENAFAACNGAGTITGANGAIVIPSAGCADNLGNTNVNVVPGATITGGVGNSGIKATTDNVNHTQWDIVNDGSIQGDHDGIEVDDGAGTGGPSSVNNRGSIVGTDAGVVLGRGGTVTNSNYIDGFVGVAIKVGAGTVNNSGQIGTFALSSTAVGLGAGGIVNNLAGGLLQAGSRGVSIDGGEGTVNNSGTIESMVRGVRFGESGTGFGTLNNFVGGKIIGGPFGSRTVSFDAPGLAVVNNAGLIDGTNLSTTVGVAAIDMFFTGTVNNMSTGIIAGVVGGIHNILSIRMQGANSIVNTQGILTGDVQFLASSDQFNMSNSTSKMTGKLLMGTGGNETATFTNVTDVNIGTISVFNGGGGGNDELKFINSSHSGGADMINWETISLSNGSNLTLTSDLTLGSLTDPTATLNINSSTLNANNGLNTLIQGKNGNALVNNAGVINVVSPGANSALTIRGNYVGLGGLLALNAVLNDDSSPADKLIIDGVLGGSSASGSTRIQVNNIGGSGAQTTSNGILVVQAINTATTTSSAFTLAGPLRAGVYDYRLFRGGLNPDPAVEQDWFLRSEHLTPINPVPIVGPELSVYGSALPTALDMTRVSIGTLEERVGDERNLFCNDHASDNHFSNGGWIRVFTQPYKAQFSSIVNPTASDNIKGFQGGLDLYRNEDSHKGLNILGAYFSYANANPDIDGLVTNEAATAEINQKTGSINLNAETGGAYVTHFWSSGAYVDLVGQLTSYQGKADSHRTFTSLNGTGGSGSAEVGYPVEVASHFMLEPEAQLLLAYAAFNHGSDLFSDISLGSSHALFGRAGLLLRYTRDLCSASLQPFARANLWSILNGDTNTAIYGPNLNGLNSLETSAQTTWLQLGGGFTMKASNTISLYSFLDGLAPVTGAHRRYVGFDVGLGLRVNV